MNSDAAHAGMSEAAMIEPSSHAVPRYVTALIVMALLVLLANAGVFFYAVYLAQLQPSVKVTDITKPLATKLCSGDTLDYQFTLNINKPGTVDVGTSFHSERSLRPSFVRLQQFIFTGPTSFVLVRHIVIPPLYTDPETNEDIPWVPGEYAQRTVINIEGRSIGAEVLEVPFTIRDDCPK